MQSSLKIVRVAPLIVRFGLFRVSRRDFGVFWRPRQRRLAVHRRRRRLLCPRRPGRDGRRGRRGWGRRWRQRRIPVVTFFFFFFFPKKKTTKKRKKRKLFVWSNCTFLGDSPGRYLIVLTAYGLLSVYCLFISKKRKKEQYSWQTFMISLPL